jgi:DNA-binding transcriptional ArsR family regulator
MPDAPEPAAAAPIIPLPGEEAVFAALADTTRRRLLKALSDGKPRTMMGLARALDVKRDNVRKHLEALCKFGLALMEENPDDGHRMLYRLAPWIRVEAIADIAWMHFGCGTLRL